MDNALQEYQLTCPYCWEVYTLWLELEADNVQLIEDCQICCNPIQLELSCAFDGEISLRAERAM